MDVACSDVSKQSASTHLWYAGRQYTRTSAKPPKALCIRRMDISVHKHKKTYRNPLVVAMELQDELAGDNLTRKQLAERHGISSDRVTQWLCLLKLPEETQKQIEALGDNWDSQILTERYLRNAASKFLSIVPAYLNSRILKKV